MQLIRRTVAALCLVAAFALVASAQNSNSSMPMPSEVMQKSLYDRLGGLPAITAVTDEFIARAAADTRINAKFGKTNVPRLRLHLIEQLCAVTGGPCVYTGMDMTKTHKNMKVTEGEFNALVEDLIGALDKFNVPATEKNDLLGLLGPLKGQIVEVNSSDTGTPLPPKFKPAKPLSDKQIKAGPKMKTMSKSKGQM
ncbi:MAG TPA: group 1 truncated hemoglobin [Pyrinomonadaceae bacterium]